MKRVLLSLVLVCLAVPAFAAKHVVLLKNQLPSDFAQTVAALGGTVTWSHADGLAVVSGLTDAAAATLADDNRVASVIADDTAFLATPVAPEAGGILMADGILMSDGSAANPALASFYPRQWHMRVVGADQAWAAGRLGSSAVTVAILDTGIDYTHPDLAGRVDLSRSTSFVESDDADVAALYPGRHPVTDLHWHGTHVASNVSSNALYAAGVTSRTTLIGVKVLDRNGGGDFSDVLAGVYYAVDQGADVLNISIQAWTTKAHSGRFISFFNRAFNYAQRHGALVIGIAGNFALDLDHDGNGWESICSPSNVLCVSATGPTSATDPVLGPWFNVDALAFYSNYGRSAIDVAAPGGTLAGRVWGSCATTSQIVLFCQNSFEAVGVGGTSQAAPHVAGLAALLVEDIGKNHPSLVKNRILQSADDVGQPGTDAEFGKGRINIPRALGLQ
jgi:subtilisin family serine protease